MYKICFSVPHSHLDSVKQAMFQAGAGKIGDYQYCAWQVLGEGQFMPLENSQAFTGEKYELNKVSEYKVEMVCTDQVIQAVVDALKATHPYEVPAYQVLKMEAF